MEELVNDVFNELITICKKINIENKQELDFEVRCFDEGSCVIISFKDYKKRLNINLSKSIGKE